MEDSISEGEIRPNAVERLSVDDYAEIKRVLCPYCRAGLPDRFQTEPHVFKHYIPGTPEMFECRAMDLRLARGCVQLAIQNPDQTLVEE